MSVRYRNHNHEARDLAQVTGENVIKFDPRAPWPCEEKAEPPKFMQKDKSDERNTHAQ